MLVANPPIVHKNFAQNPDVRGTPIALNVRMKLIAASFGVYVASAPINGSFVVLKICDAKQKHKNSPSAVKTQEMP